MVLRVSLITVANYAILYTAIIKDVCNIALLTEEYLH